MSRSKSPKKRLSKPQLIAAISTLIIMVLVTAGILLHNHQVAAQKKHQAELAHQKYEAELQQFGKLNNEYFDVFQQLVESSNLTKSQADWDNFYSGQISKVGDIKTGITNASFSDFSGSKLDTVGSELNTDCDHLSYLLNLGKSNIDIQYQIEEDKAVGDSGQLATDQQTNQTQQSQLKDAFNVVTQDGVKLTSDSKSLGL